MSQLQRENRAVDVKPPSLPSNLEKIYEATSENEPVFNCEGFYADLRTQLDEQTDTLNEIMVKCLARIKNSSSQNIADDLLMG